jgi:hypothetical protein
MSHDGLGFTINDRHYCHCPALDLHEHLFHSMGEFKHPDSGRDFSDAFVNLVNVEYKVMKVCECAKFGP